jgi:hypothetical protein
MRTPRALRGEAQSTSLLLEGELCATHSWLFLDVAHERVCDEPGERALTPAARGTRGA